MLVLEVPKNAAIIYWSGQAYSALAGEFSKEILKIRIKRNATRSSSARHVRCMARMTTHQNTVRLSERWLTKGRVPLQQLMSPHGSRSPAKLLEGRLPLICNGMVRKAGHAVRICNISGPAFGGTFYEGDKPCIWPPIGIYLDNCVPPRNASHD
ncbi:hypothetical protein M404DRAFT_752889 [Pisolithus tinctorius Marx 270]|uniref:Uncharacterized protein n=1 Tax=Pisolithus tinctorius Marx 270 TaxID=870435 RepID=A0A0C3P0E9_PISTI|nr:hypothetical protein M404DRAFT_752889 [Pisolithus tinctorius Marx 270]